MNSKDEIVGTLKGLLGADQVLTDQESLKQRSIDTWPLKRVQVALGAQMETPLCVVRPRSTEEVAKVLSTLYQQGVTVVPFGGGSGVHGGAIPPKESVVLDVGEMNQIRSLDEENQVVTVQAGVFWSHLEAWLNERGYITGHYPQSIDVAQAGGLVATRSAGQFSTKYGNIEDLVITLEAVLPDGQIVRTKNVPRRSVGPDLRHVWIGSEGAFGVITEITVKIFPKPADRWMSAYGIETLPQGLDIIQKFIRQGWKPAVVRLHDALEAAQSYPGHVKEGESILLLMSEGPEGYAQLEGAACDRIVRAGGGRPLGSEPVEAWLEHRNDMRHFYESIDSGVVFDTAEVAASWTNIGPIYDSVVERLKTEVPQLTRISGHSSHSYPQGTNMYFVFGLDTPQDPAEVERIYWSVWSRIMEVTLENGGTICHHHGIGKLRARWVPEDLANSYRILQGMKKMLDPKGLLNPGALLPVTNTDTASSRTK